MFGGWNQHVRGFAMQQLLGGGWVGRSTIDAQQRQASFEMESTAAR
jgi:hypothetical protein